MESGLCFEIGGFGFGGNDEMAVTVAEELGIRRYQAEAIVNFFVGLWESQHISFIVKAVKPFKIKKKKKLKWFLFHTLCLFFVTLKFF